MARLQERRSNWLDDSAGGANCLPRSGAGTGARHPLDTVIVPLHLQTNLGRSSIPCGEGGEDDGTKRGTPGPLRGERWILGTSKGALGNARSRTPGLLAVVVTGEVEVEEEDSESKGVCVEVKR